MKAAERIRRLEMASAWERIGQSLIDAAPEDCRERVRQAVKAAPVGGGKDLFSMIFAGLPPERVQPCMTALKDKLYELKAGEPV
jgi:hypothetical protein